MSQIFNREGAIDALVDSDKDYILNNDGGLEWLESILKGGHTGYQQLFDAQLVQECMERNIPDSKYWTTTNNG